MLMHNPLLLSRRAALKTISTVAFAAAVSKSFSADSSAKRKMTINLMPGMIGVRASQRELIELAHAHGFESVEPLGSELAGMSKDEIAELLAPMRGKRVQFGAAGLPVDIRGEDSKFDEDL